MFGYYLTLALHSFRRNKVLTALMVLAIALGIGTSMTTLTVLHVLSGDPIPSKSKVLFIPQIDAADMDNYSPGQEPAVQLTRWDAEALLAAKRADRQALMTGGSVAVVPKRGELKPFNVFARYASADFFPMFETPFARGTGWSGADDARRARVVVISEDLANKVFGTDDVVGQTLQLEQTEFRIVGVRKDWSPSPNFFDLNLASYGNIEDVYLPFSTAAEARLPRNGTIDCFASRPEGMLDTDLGASCMWMQFWVELDSPQKVRDYRAFLENYSDQQRAAGRFSRPTNVRLRNVMEWLENQGAVPSDIRLQTWLAFGFLLVCIVNTIGLLLAKFLKRTGEIGVRRALGASRRSIFAQYLVEAGSIGLAGGVLGLGLAQLGLWAVRSQPVDYADLVHLDGWMLLTTFVLAVASSALAGLLPAWRACCITPAMQLKSQ